MNIIELIDSRLARLRSQVSGLVRRGRLALVTASYFCQILGHDGERWDDVELWQQFGLASRPAADSEILVVLLGGRGEGALAIASQSRDHRPFDLEQDEVVLYGKADAGQPVVRLQPDGTVLIFSGGASPGTIILNPDGSIDAAPASGKTINIAGSTDYQLLGGQVVAAMTDFATSMSSATTFVNINTAGSALGTAIAGWLSSKAKVA